MCRLMGSRGSFSLCSIVNKFNTISDEEWLRLLAREAGDLQRSSALSGKGSQPRTPLRDAVIKSGEK